MKQLIATKYKRFVLYLEVVFGLLTLFLIYNYIPVNHGTKTFYLASSRSEDVVAQLKKEGYDVTPIDKVVIQLIKTPKEGWYRLDPDAQGRFLFFEQMYKQRTAKLMHLRIYAGETTEELLARLANDMKLDKEKLARRYHTLAHFKEGDILAGEYTIARDADENATIDFLFAKSRQKVAQLQKKYFSSPPDPLEMQVIYKVASIIQKESNSPREMPLISSVIYNRIEKNMKLQMDSTLNYGPYAHTDITPERIKSDTSRYNTYKYKGLPPHPLSTVTPAALEAAILPAETNYLFFMLTPTGEHSFASTYEEHLSNIRAFRHYQKQKKLGIKTTYTVKKKEQKKSISEEEFNATFAVTPAHY